MFVRGRRGWLQGRHEWLRIEGERDVGEGGGCVRAGDFGWCVMVSSGRVVVCGLDRLVMGGGCRRKME